MTTKGAEAGVFEGASAGDAVALTRALVATPSVNPVLEAGGAGERAVAELTAGWLESWGFEVDVVEVADGRFNTIGRRGTGSGPTLILNGHLDTVGVEGMTVDPFAAELRDGRLWGRGSCDMKGGVASLLAAAAATAGDRLEGTLIVALTGDEEHASLGMVHLVESGVRADAAVVCEPTGLAVMPAHKGFVWVEADFTGRAAHGSRPEVGVDAILHAGRFLAALDGLQSELRGRSAHPLLGHGTLHAGTIQGGVAASVYPERCTVVLERRTLPGETGEGVTEEFRAVLEATLREESGSSGGDGVSGLTAEIRQGLTRSGTEVPVESSLVTGLLRACAGEGVAESVEGMTAWVDAAFLNEAGIPAVCFGPGSIAQAHSVDEWIDPTEIEACARVLTRFVREMLG